ncbi:MAG TPA: hypothetical protein VE954_00690 [Oligoflexus sp.]|uniref:hypothetical protein n=1 Tax=Oligoflexus sp. TaxID=1971216 RepID=UPI002D42CE95|nr:hypothetical protein [Oligoflexus sp.]HYX31596.1 hypothetical protein [Oligoflexus sp.]
MYKILPILTATFVATGCLTRAPTSYELDRRAGMLPPSQDTSDKGIRTDLSGLRTNSSIPRSPEMPMRLPPLIEKVWLSDMTLADGVKMQGTWIFVEVEPGRWLDEFDPGGAPLTSPETPELGTKKKHQSASTKK